MTGCVLYVEICLRSSVVASSLTLAARSRQAQAAMDDVAGARQALERAEGEATKLRQQLEQHVAARESQAAAIERLHQVSRAYGVGVPGGAVLGV